MPADILETHYCENIKESFSIIVIKSIKWKDEYIIKKLYITEKWKWKMFSDNVAIIDSIKTKFEAKISASTIKIPEVSGSKLLRRYFSFLDSNVSLMTDVAPLLQQIVIKGNRQLCNTWLNLKWTDKNASFKNGRMLESLLNQEHKHDTNEGMFTELYLTLQIFVGYELIIWFK